MKQQITRSKILFVSLLLFGIVMATSYLQTIFHFNTYLALIICLIDTIIAALLLFG